jgi:hypothetical protein
MSNQQTSHRTTRSYKPIAAVAICLALAAAGYGIANTTTHVSPLSQPAAAPAAAEVPMSFAARSSAAREQPAAVAIAGATIEAPRECALDKGINDACIFN